LIKKEQMEKNYKSKIYKPKKMIQKITNNKNNKHYKKLTNVKKITNINKNKRSNGKKFSLKKNGTNQKERMI